LIFQGINVNKGNYNWDSHGDGADLTFFPDIKYRVALASKRGNSVYLRRLEGRLGALRSLKGAPPQFSRSTSAPTSAVLFITLTYARDSDLKTVWKSVGKDFNRWKSGIVRKYGKFDFIRTWEAHKDGYPHIHIVLIFKDAKFSVFRYKNRWRIKEKSQFEWSWGWVDVQAVESEKEGIKYITKYLRKIHYGSDWKATLSLSLTWFYNKRSWSMSRALNDLIRTLHNSNKKLKERLARDELDMGYAGDVWRWELLGFWGGGELPPWVDLLDPKPSPGEIKSEQFMMIYCTEGWNDFRYMRPRSDMEIEG